VLPVMISDAAHMRRAKSRNIDRLRAVGVIVVGSVGYVHQGLILVHVFVHVFPS
jgi:hypothetical protein